MSDETERGRTKRRSAGGLGRLSFGFGFEPWVIIFVLVSGFAMKMGYPILLVLDSSPQVFGGVSFILLEA
jgi:hypothetical protein